MQILVDLLDCNSKLHKFLFRMVYCFSKHNGLTWKKLMSGGGVFVNGEEYDAYCRAWDALPNAKVVMGEYLAYFASSDAMILDSVSFMAEYLYVHKPALFLTREGERFIFRQVLDYADDHGKSATQFIYDDIVHAIGV